MYLDGANQTFSLFNLFLSYKAKAKAKLNNWIQFVKRKWLKVVKDHVPRIDTSVINSIC